MNYQVNWHTAISPSSTFYDGVKTIAIPDYIEDKKNFARKLIARDGCWSPGQIVIESMEAK